jgi:hypothetical protein
MESNLNQVRQQAHALLDMLPAEKLNAVRSLLEVMVEPDRRGALSRPCFPTRGEGIPHEEILREFGLNR